MVRELDVSCWDSFVGDGDGYWGWFWEHYELSFGF